MNNDLEQFSEERLKELLVVAETVHISVGLFNVKEIIPILRIALAAKQDKPTFEEWMSNQSEKIEVDCGCVTTEAFYHWLKVAYEATPQPAHTERDGWIKCSERMPPSSDPVWAYAQPGFEYAVEAYWDGDWYRTLTDEPEYSITHWMPLPAAPKPESE